MERDKFFLIPLSLPNFDLSVASTGIQYWIYFGFS